MSVIHILYKSETDLYTILYRFYTYKPHKNIVNYVKFVKCIVKQSVKDAGLKDFQNSLKKLIYMQFLQKY